MTKILIIDDEIAAGNILKVLIQKHIPAVTEICYCDNVTKALELLKTFNPTLVMLDIEMPKLNGFDFLNMATPNDFDVVFTTAYDQYAIKAIRFSALDYLLKPIDTIDLKNAVSRHIVKQQNQHQQLLVSNLLTNLQQKDPKNFKLALSTTEGVSFFAPDDILYCEGENNYTRFTFLKAKPILISKTIGDYEDLLKEHGFLRIHKSYLVNAKYVTKIDREGAVVMHDGKQLTISKRRKEAVMSALK
ncbi:MAG TPA: LytTR family DNA-binding domain-containing protein [Chitinophagaceae bacterium]|jgi:two-component system LytT family response regulator|nr:LytTR family DNA-binding domain-containing protein [Chitinophagaceae bacterium]